MPAFGVDSKRQLLSCHPDLQRVFNEVVKYRDCKVLQGARTVEEELQHIADGTSKLKDPKNSKHVIHAGRPLADAVDVAPYPVDWNDHPRFYFFAGFVMGIAQSLGVKLRFGGDWDSDGDVAEEAFKDLVHFERVP